MRCRKISILKLNSCNLEGFFMRKVVLGTEIFTKSKALKMYIFWESAEGGHSPRFIYIQYLNEISFEKVNC